MAAIRQGYRRWLNRLNDDYRRTRGDAKSRFVKNSWSRLRKLGGIAALKELDTFVTQDHIDIGCTDSRRCPVALSLRESTGLHPRVNTDLQKA